MGELKEIDFRSSIQSKEINDNFNEINKQMKRERIRLGGFGIVEGFKMSALSKKELRIGDGVIIGKDGKELIFTEQVIPIDPVEPKKIHLDTKSEALAVGPQGEIYLPDSPYSVSKQGLFSTSYYQSIYPTGELVVRDRENSDVKIRVIAIDENVLTVDSKWSGKKVFVDYSKADSRLDTILIDEDGHINIEKGIHTTSPSHVDLSQYEDKFVLGFVENTVSVDDYLEVYEMDRYFRPIFVNEANELYLNGKKYMESFIYFEEPSAPIIDTLWYNRSMNQLYVWESVEGVEQWVIVNSTDYLNYKETILFTPEDNPEDEQTFLFNNESLYFIPGHHQLFIVVDNVILMSDQYTEVTREVDDKYENAGIGFKLNAPLDKPAHIEVHVMHTIQTSPIRKTFQRIGSYANDSYQYVVIDENYSGIFKTEQQYRIGEEQLEVYVDGVRLQRDLDFVELLSDGNVMSSDEDKGKLTNLFKVTKPLIDKQVLSTKTYHNIFSYSHLDQMVADIRDTADHALSIANELEDDISNIGENVDQKISELKQDLEEVRGLISDEEQFIKRTDVIDESNIPDRVMNNLFTKSVQHTYAATPIIPVEDLKITDHYDVFLSSENSNRILMRTIDYMPVDSEGHLTIQLNDEIADGIATIYVTGISIG